MSRHIAGKIWNMKHTSKERQRNRLSFRWLHILCYAFFHSIHRSPIIEAFIMTFMTMLQAQKWMKKKSYRCANNLCVCWYIIEKGCWSLRLLCRPRSTNLGWKKMWFEWRDKMKYEKEKNKNTVWTMFLCQCDNWPWILRTDSVVTGVFFFCASHLHMHRIKIWRVY